MTIRLNHEIPEMHEGDVATVTAKAAPGWLLAPIAGRWLERACQMTDSCIVFVCFVPFVVTSSA